MVAKICETWAVGMGHPGLLCAAHIQRRWTRNRQRDATGLQEPLNLFPFWRESASVGGEKKSLGTLSYLQKEKESLKNVNFNFLEEFKDFIKLKFLKKFSKTYLQDFI
jgi:hypothetical protein